MDTWFSLGTIEAKREAIKNIIFDLEKKKPPAEKAHKSKLPKVEPVEEKPPKQTTPPKLVEKNEATKEPAATKRLSNESNESSDDIVIESSQIAPKTRSNKAENNATITTTSSRAHLKRDSHK